jgi:hypothetical protein
MNSIRLENEITLIRKLSSNKSVLIPVINHIDYYNSNKNQEEENILWLPQLMNISVTKRNIFTDDEWDYNLDALNPPRSVQGAKLRLNFAKHSHIPAYVMTELKCLCHLVMLVPIEFRKKTKGRKPKVEIKHNTVIAKFDSGLKFINSVFKNLQSLGGEFVNDRFQSLTDILDSDFRDVAASYEYAVGNELKQFLGYLNNPFTTNVLGEVIKVDFSSLDWPEQTIKRRKEKLIFENDDFEKLVNHSTYTVIDFLNRINEEVEDKTALSYKNVLKKNHQLNFEFNEDLLNDYTIIRLLSIGYSKTFIASKCLIPKEFLNNDGSLMFHEYIRKVVKKKYNISHFDDIRKYVNEVYYSSAYLIAQYTAMRPSEMSEVVLSNCLVKHEGFDLIVSNVKKNPLENLKLFDDKWVVIPIMKDAITAATKISILKNNDYLFSNMDTVGSKSAPSNMSPGGITNFFTNFLEIVLGKTQTAAIKLNAYMTRHTLAYQLHRIELGLPFISFQLKHIVNTVDKFTSFGATSKTTLGYGEIAESIVLNKAQNKTIRRLAEVEKIKTVMDPDGTYVGPKAEEHKARIQKVFQGYQAAGYSKEEVFDAMAEQGMAVINVGTGFCFGGVEDFDESIPCIGTLRCNPIRCSNAIVTKANAPKWREIYITNKELLIKDGYEERKEQIIATVNESKAVLLLLGEELD